jgi:predicted phage terminase large subunit-like protein
VVQEMRLHNTVRPILSQPQYSKEARLLAQAPKFEAGQVLLPREAPWLAEYVAELLAFPNGAHDDQVDSTSQALHWLSPRIASGIPRRRPNPERPLGTARLPQGPVGGA